MKYFKTNLYIFSLFLVCSLLSPSCRNTSSKAKTEITSGSTEVKTDSAISDFAQIKEKGELNAVTLNTSVSYFIYRMLEMGYEYELIEDFANSHKLRLNIKIAENITRLEEMLEAGEADIVAYPVQKDNTMKQKVLFCGLEQQNHLVVVQPTNKKETMITDVTQLIGKEVWVKHGSRFHERLINLNTELGGGIVIKNIERDTVTTEDLIEMVSLGEIDYTVSENHLARLNRTYYRNIDISLSIGFPQRASWMVRKDCPELAEAVDEWAANISKNKKLRATAKRYFEQSKRGGGAIEKVVIKNGELSPYDDLFKKYAKGTNWDWRLLVSIAYQESKFQNHLTSWAGATGLMGIMPPTARGLGISPDSLHLPEISIQASVKCLTMFQRSFKKIKDKEEQLKFTLASYNAGNGHVFDAQRLASKYGYNPNVWDGNVERYIKLKREPEYYNDSVCRHGYLRGTETFRYVKEVMARYKNYKEKT